MAGKFEGGGSAADFRIVSKRRSAVGDPALQPATGGSGVTESEPRVTMSNFVVAPAFRIDELSARCDPRGNPCMARMATITNAHAKAAGERLASTMHICDLPDL